MQMFIYIKEVVLNYRNLYVNLLKKHGTVVKPADGLYYERHHIVPRSLGGSDTPDNLVYLSGRAHFIAHWILYKIHGGGPMGAAFNAMCMAPGWAERYKPTSRGFASARAAVSVHSASNALAQWADPVSRAKIQDSVMFMFDDPNHPMCMAGKFGHDHPRSRAVTTPLGTFGSVRIAGRVHEVAHNMISRRCKSTAEKYKDYFYVDGLG